MRTLQTDTGVIVWAERWDATGRPAAPTGHAVSDLDVSALAPALSYKPAAHQYLVFWTKAATDGHVLQGRIMDVWVGSDGAVTPSSELPIFRYLGWQMNPDIALGIRDGEAFTIWQDGRHGVGSDVYGRLGALDHTPPVAAFTTDPSVGLTGAPFTFDASPSRDVLTPPARSRCATGQG